MDHSQAAQQETRDQFGKFSKPSTNNPNTPNFPDLFRFLSKITIKRVLTYTAVIALLLSNTFVQNAIARFFPHSSPIFGREVSYQGILQAKGQGSYTLLLPDSTVWTLEFKPSSNLTRLKDMEEVLVKGNLTYAPFYIINAEVFPLSSSDNSSESSQNTKYDIQNTNIFPKLFSGLTWETDEKKLLVFTSGKRRMNIEGEHLESSQVDTFPQKFIDYYENALSQNGFTKTLDSKSPDGVSYSWEKDGTYFSFGVKNILPTKKQATISSEPIGFVAFIEHN